MLVMSPILLRGNPEPCVLSPGHHLLYCAWEGGLAGSHSLRPNIDQIYSSFSLLREWHIRWGA